MVRHALLAAALALCVVPAARAQEPLTPEKLARVRFEEEKALARVDAAHGHRPPSEMSAEERRQVIAEQAAATEAAQRREGVDAKTYARATAGLSREEHARMESTLEGLRAPAAPRPPQRTAPGEIEIDYGTPVDLTPPEEAAGGGEIPIEYGTPIPIEPPAEPSGEALPPGK
ncbi:hypothetical protein FGE12_24085 [Aggregicoccus sp. 17bor-14]|uniref:hypothetical protein n=1 Tax=Myxococcaceae TaxID=31 RepID=UPI00129CD4D8|nr:MULTISPECIES: hypothetical protein [Myxococcaceae]MBF5045509.1 hypothetical protein [Simulacricoccus sp. 17bor-14]MRI91246.1 hypothetical protein [Aggregicoccus sp. 17bor-14]